MFSEGTIIYFDPFYFKNGNTAKPKYFVVLKKIEEQNIIASLPTRNDSVPQKNEIDNGCIEIPDINFNCYVISDSVEVTTCGKTFDFKTHIYGHEVDDYSIEFLKEIYPNENSDYHIWGEMKQEIFESLINCLKESKTLKRKYKKIFNP